MEQPVTSFWKDSETIKAEIYSGLSNIYYQQRFSQFIFPQISLKTLTTKLARRAKALLQPSQMCTQ